MSSKVLKLLPTNKKISQENIQKYFSFVVVILLIAMFTALQPSFINSANLVNLLSDSAPLMIMAAGMTPILLLGSIDLSIGSVCSVSNVLIMTMMMRFAKTMDNPFLVMAIAIPLTLVVGVISGIVLGFIHVKWKVPSFIASLAFMSIWESGALMINQTPTALPKALYPTVKWYTIHFGPVGMPLVLAILLIIGLHLVITRTAMGRSLYAIGGNERAARIAGIKVDRYKIIVFAINGFCAATGAIFLMAKAKSSAPTVGSGFTLMVISAVVLGGTSLIGGAGNILKTILGVFIVAIIKNGMNIVGVNVYWQKIVYGLIILIAVALSVDRSSRNFVVK